MIHYYIFDSVAPDGTELSIDYDEEDEVFCIIINKNGDMRYRELKGSYDPIFGIDNATMGDILYLSDELAKQL